MAPARAPRPPRKELLGRYVRLFHGAPIARHFGMRLSYTPDGRAVFDLPYNPRLDHALGGVHGGVYATMLDNAGWFTAAPSHGAFRWVATAELTVHLLEPARHTSLRSVGRLLKRGKRQDVAEAHLYDGKGRLIAHGVGTFIVLPGLRLPQTRPAK